MNARTHAHTHAPTQVLALSATYTPELLADLEPLMKRPQRVMTCSDSVSLLGVRQFYVPVPVPAAAAAAGEQQAGAQQAAVGASGPELFRRKVSALLGLLSEVSFHQAGGGWWVRPRGCCFPLLSQHVPLLPHRCRRSWAVLCCAVLPLSWCFVMPCTQ